MDAIEIQALVNNSLPLQFRTISPRSYLGLDHNQPLEDKSDDDDDYGDSAGSYCNHHLHHHRNHHQHHHEQHSKHHKYANHRAANIPLDDDSDADDDDEESSCSSSSASEKKEALKKIQNNPFHPIDFNQVLLSVTVVCRSLVVSFTQSSSLQAFTSSPQVKHALMTEYKELLIQAVKDESKDEHSAKVATVTCQWSKTWGVFHEFAGKNLKLNFHVEMSGKLQPFQPLSPKDLFDSIQ